MSVKEFKKNEIIFKQGDFSPVMYDILAGQVGIFAAYGTENEKQITVLGEGQVLGEMGLIEAYPRSATAVAMEDGVKLWEIGEKEFSAYFSEQLFDIFVTQRIATILAVLVAVVVYIITLLLLRAVKKEDILQMPKGEKILKILEKHKLIR